LFVDDCGSASSSCDSNLLSSFKQVARGISLLRSSSAAAAAGGGDTAVIAAVWHTMAECHSINMTIFFVSYTTERKQHPISAHPLTYWPAIIVLLVVRVLSLCHI
jgi:hypothetical protein